jgi:hypothetical protein
LHEPDDREKYRFVTEELLDEMMDHIHIPGMISHFIYEEFHPNDEDDITQAIDEFLYALFNQELKEPESMFYFRLSQENMRSTDGNLLSIEEFKVLVSEFYEAYPILTEHSFKVEKVVIEGDDSTAEVNIEWQGVPKNEKAIVRHEGLSKFRLTRSVYGGWDIIRVNIPGWRF